jgi:hypothetical protein
MKMTSINQAATLESRAIPTNRLPHVSHSGARASQAKNSAVAFANQAARAVSLENLYLILTNDSRSVIFFDRCSVIVHYGGKSEVSATSNEPMLNKRSEFAEASGNLARSLKGQTKPILMAKSTLLNTPHESGISSDCLEHGLLFLQTVGSERLLIIPLVCSGIPIGHLVIEFFDETTPDDEQISALLEVTPFLAQALGEKLILENHPEIHLRLAAQPSAFLQRVCSKRSAGILLVIALILVVLFAIPIPFSVGGEVEIVSDFNQFAFCGTDGTVREVFVREGESVEKDTLLARLDSKELDFQTTVWTNQTKILAHEIGRLMVEAGDKPSLLAEKRIVELKHEAALAELHFLNWKRQHLEVRAPIQGIVITRDINTFVGRRYRSGEPFAEIADPRRLQATVYVPENRIASVRLGMPMRMYLNNSPTTAHDLTVHMVSPMVETMPRLGNVFRATADVPPENNFKIGMTGIGRIHTDTLCLFTILENRLMMLWNQIPFLF